ncbi:MAG: YdcF family protein [Coriobacteriales bacterium]
MLPGPQLRRTRGCGILCGMAHNSDTAEKRYPVTRGLCLFFGLFALLNVISCLKGGVTSQNMNMWWLDLSGLTVAYNGSSVHFGFIVEELAAIAMILWALRPAACLARRVLTCVLTASIAVFALLNAVTYWQTLASGALYSALPVPLSFVIAALFALVTVRIACSNPRRGGGPLDLAGVLAAALAFVFAFPLLQIGFFGTTDYRRPADCAVVFGARVYEDGTLSTALRERMDTAVELYEQGLVSKLVVSGGIEEGESGTDEAQAMYNYALAHDVPASALLIDRYGDSTELSVNNTIKLAGQYGFESIIATSSFYHLPRIKMLYNLSNVDVLTVPTVGNIAGNGTLVSIWREIPAWWLYWFKGSF